MQTPRSLLTLTALALVAACGAEAPADFGGDTDDLSDATVSMEMVRQNPALNRAVTVPEGRVVPGKGRPALSGGAAGGVDSPWKLGPGTEWLYDANGLGQFKQLADPALHKDDKASATYARKPGDLFATDNKLAWDQVAQGGLGDCYFAAALSAVLFADKAGTVAKDLIQPVLANGKAVSYMVTFYQASGRKVRVEVDPDLPHSNKSGDVYYMSSTQNVAGYEEWAPSLVEKAYAKWHRSYNAIGNGGAASDVIWALTGKNTRDYSPKSASVVDAIEKAGKAGRAQTACTFGDKDGVAYEGTGIHSDHCYTLRGVLRKSGKVYVQLRNPWGPWHDTEPNDDGVQDGVFDLELAKFQKLYADVSIAQ